MNTTYLSRAISVSFALFSLTVNAQAGGSLTPPVGTPNRTMKTLDQLEARTPILSLPITIDQAGSYYLTKHLVSTGEGITVTASNVSIDLNGFTIKGTGITGVLVHGGGQLQSVSIQNGGIDGFSTGVKLQNASNCMIRDLSCLTQSGLLMDSTAGPCSNNMVIQFRTSGIGTGLYLGGPGKTNGNMFLRCQVTRSGYGIMLQPSGNAGECSGNIFQGCSIFNTGNTGIYFEALSGKIQANSIRNCNISGVPSKGIYFLGNTYVTSGCNSNLIDGNNISQCSSNGIYLSNADGNLIRNNTIHGVSLIAISLVSSDANRIENNHMGDVSKPKLGDSYGIKTTTGFYNLVIKNTSLGPTAPFLLDSDDTYGPTINAFGSNLQINANPWANLGK